MYKKRGGGVEHAYHYVVYPYIQKRKQFQIGIHTCQGAVINLDS